MDSFKGKLQEALKTVEGFMGLYELCTKNILDRLSYAVMIWSQVVQYLGGFSTAFVI